MSSKDSQTIDMALLVRIFVEFDDFYQLYVQWQQRAQLPASDATGAAAQGVCQRRQPRMTVSEIVTILVYYHHSGYKNFQYYYQRLVQPRMQAEFPHLVSYNRFVELIPRVAMVMYLYGQYVAHQQDVTGIAFIDSKKLPVCDNRRIGQHKVFQGLAQRGKSATGWFYGFKIHLVINHLGEILRFCITPANVADNNPAVLAMLLHRLHGKVFGDKGYLTAFFQYFYERGVHIISKIRKNMPNKLMSLHDKILLKKRPVIEAVNDILMTLCDIDHTRHRSPINAHTHICAATIAYAYIPNKPSIILQHLLA